MAESCPRKETPAAEPPNGSKRTMVSQLFACGDDDAWNDAEGAPTASEAKSEHSATLEGAAEEKKQDIWDKMSKAIVGR